MKQLFYINAGNTDEALKKVLSMRIGERHCSFAISDKIGDQLFTLAYYSADEINVDVLSEIFSKHNELHSSFFEVQVSYDYASSILMPHHYHNPGETKNMMDAMYGGSVHSSIMTETISEWQLYNIYSVPVDVHEWVSRIFPACRHRHNYTLNMLMTHEAEVDRLLVAFEKEEFSFIIIKQNKLLIAQTLTYTTPEDILYYLIKSCNQFSLSREEVRLSICGLIEKESQLYRELYQYFLHVEFRDPVWKLPETSSNGFPMHFFTSLNDLARCAS